MKIPTKTDAKIFRSKTRKRWTETEMNLRNLVFIELFLYPLGDSTEKTWLWKWNPRDLFAPHQNYLNVQFSCNGNRNSMIRDGRGLAKEKKKKKNYSSIPFNLFELGMLFDSVKNAIVFQLLTWKASISFFSRHLFAPSSTYPIYFPISFLGDVIYSRTSPVHYDSTQIIIIAFFIILRTLK